MVGSLGHGISGSLCGQALSEQLIQSLAKANHIPLLIANKQPYSLEEFPNYVGEFDFRSTIRSSAMLCAIVKNFLGVKVSKCSQPRQKYPVS
uniref:hypothetical protein n=1 Tax=Vibrio cholerae TaxID=666 RepID=UPI003F58D8A1